MSFISQLSSTKNVNRVEYQPNYPLEYDKNHGPYSSIKTLEESIKRDFENILLTSPGEWPMDPQVGVGIKNFLFNNFGTFDRQELQAKIVNQISKYLPSVQLLNLEVVVDSNMQDKNSMAIKIIYSILGKTLVDSTMSITDSGGVDITTNSLDKHSSSFRDRAANLRSQITEI